MTKVDCVNIFIINEMVEDHSKVMNITGNHGEPRKIIK